MLRLVRTSAVAAPPKSLSELPCHSRARHEWRSCRCACSFVAPLTHFRTAAAPMLPSSVSVSHKGSPHRARRAALSCAASQPNPKDLIRKRKPRTPQPYEGRTDSPSDALRLAASSVVHNHAEATRLFARSVELDPYNGRAWQDWANFESRTRRSSRAAEQVLTNALRHNPRNPYLWQSLAVLCQRAQRYREAVQHCQKGLLADDGHLPLYATWAIVEGRLGNCVEARRIFERAEAVGHPGPKLYHAWGRMELKQRNSARAVELFEKGLAQDPANSYIWHSMGSAARTNGLLSRARFCFQKALKVNEANAVVLLDWARVEADDGNDDLARELFAKGASFAPADSHLLHSWSFFEFQREQYRDAGSLIRKALKTSPSDSVLWCHQAKIQAALCDFDKARASYKHACKVNPMDWLAWDNWSAMEHRIGNTEEAERLLQEAFKVRFNAQGAFNILANTITDKQR